MLNDREEETRPEGHEVEVPPLDDAREAGDTTLAGYFRIHDRPPAFEGVDGYPYTVSIEVEKVPDLRTPFEGYLVFPRWAQNGVGIVGHVETPTLWRGRSQDGVRREAGQLSLEAVQAHLDTAIRTKAAVTEP